THNALSIAAITATAPSTRAYELQRLHGMGEAVYDEVVAEGTTGVACRIYAPVGPHEDLVAYLVRRLLETGANTSFVNRLADAHAPIEELVRDPMSVIAAERESAAKPRQLPRPPDIFAPERRNSGGLAVDEPSVRAALLADLRAELK